MLTKIKKRDGRLEDFNSKKITDAIWKAAMAVGGADTDTAQKISAKIVEFIGEKYSDGYPTVEQVQDAVEKVLVEEGHYKTAKAYILYRKQHQDIRQVDDLFSNMDLVDKYINLDDWRIKENANMAYSLQGLNFHISSIVSAQYWLTRIYPEQIKKAHSEGDFHIHDLGTISVYCVGWDLQDLLLTGFKGVSGKISCKPAKHLRSALGQIVNFFYTLQGEAAGAQAFSDFDTYLAPFVRHDNLTYKQVKQAMQEFIYNINVPTRVGFQTPFTNITCDLKIPGFMKNEKVIIGGKYQEDTYGDYQKELDMINKALIEVMAEGDADGRVFTFPVPTYNITKDFDWETPELDTFWELTAKYGIPTFSNFINSDLSPDDVRSMCCRLRLDKKELQKRGGGLFGSNPLTGSVGVVTINLPRLGYLANDEKDLFERLDKLMDLARDSLETKRKVLEQLTERGLYPYSKFYLRVVYQRFKQYWKNHFATIGLVGLNECALNFLGKGIGDKEGSEFAERVLTHMSERLEKYQEETGNIYNLEATPAEGTSYRLARLDKEKCPNIIFANPKAVEEGTAVPYYTNSSQLPVDFTDDVFEALTIQDPLQTKYTGGTVFHIYLGERHPDKNSVKLLVNKVAENFKLPYFSISPTFSICPVHGYISGEHKFCPKCDEEIIHKVHAQQGQKESIQEVEE